MKKVTGKTIVLTGANSGIGLETLKLLAAEDNKILAVDLRTDKIEEFDKEKVIPFVCDVSKQENVDSIFDKATEVLGSIDLFIANAGFPYYEVMDYVSWERVENIFKVNVFSPIYSYQKYVEYLNGKEGRFAITVSAIGKMAIPGYTLYSASKFAMQGFQQGIRLEMPKNVKLTTLYPIATDTGFYKGLAKGRKYVNPSKLFTFSRFLMAICPPVRTIYWNMEYGKLARYEAQKKEAEANK